MKKLFVLGVIIGVIVAFIAVVKCNQAEPEFMDEFDTERPAE